MNQITKVFEGSEVRILEIEGSPWFVAKDVCTVLELSNSRIALQRLDKDEVSSTYITDSLGRNQETSIINEAGLYTLILGSRKPEAKTFKRWVTHEVIPTIRKTGGYVANDNLFIETYLPFADEPTRLMFGATLETVRKQNEVISIMQPKAEQHDRFISGENYQTLEQVAKTLGVGRNKLTAFLKTIGIFTQRGTSPVPYQQHLNSEYFVVKQTPSSFGDFNNVQTYVTAKGVSYIDGLLKKYGGASYINSMRLSDIKQIKRIA